MTTSAPVTDEEFTGLLSSIRDTAFRLEARDSYAVTCEREAYQRFLNGELVRPDNYGWWREWLAMIAALTSDGKTISRVRVLSEPPSDYQRWEIAGDPWHTQTGERIDYLPRSKATQLGLPLDHDWWLLDGQRLIDMRFTTTGEDAGKTLITDPGDIAPYLKWRDLAVQHAIPADQYTAA